MEASAGTARQRTEEVTRTRRLAALVAVLLAAAAVVVATYVDAVAVCRDAVAGTKTVRVCSPPSATELAVLFIPALILLWPDLAEIGLFGINLKRKVDEIGVGLRDTAKGLQDTKKVVTVLPEVLSAEELPDEAQASLEQEALDGNVVAAQTLGLLLERQDQKDEAIKWQQFAADRGDHMAMYNLGRMLYERQPDDPEAVKWLRRSDDPLAAKLLRNIESGDAGAGS